MAGVVFHCVYIHTHTPHVLYPSSVTHDGRLVCFHVLSIVNSARNRGVHVFFQIMIFSRCMPRSGTAGLYGNYLFIFLRNPYCSPQWLYSFAFPPTVQSTSIAKAYMTSVLSREKCLVKQASQEFCNDQGIIKS